MKNKIYQVLLAGCLIWQFGEISQAYAYDTPPQLVNGISIGSDYYFEVSFPNMDNPLGCGFNGAFTVDYSVDIDTRKAMLSVLLTAKFTGTPVRVRLIGCADRPTFNFVFMDADWL